MASAFDPSVFIAAEEREQSLAAPASDFAFDPVGRKAQQNSSLAPVPTPSLATLATLAGGDAQILPWTAELKRFTDQPCPPGLRPEYWDELTHEAWTVSREWGRQALDAGWSSMDLFGCNPVPFPFARRVDRDGLVMALVGLMTPTKVVEITPAGAMLRDRQSTLFFRRRAVPGTVHLWEAYAMSSGP